MPQAARTPCRAYRHRLRHTVRSQIDLARQYGSGASSLGHSGVVALETMRNVVRRSDTGTYPKCATLIPDETLDRAGAYLSEIRVGRCEPGGLVQSRLRGMDRPPQTGVDLLGVLFDTKVPQIFAESAVAGDGSDWSLVELGLLGDISVAADVRVFDDGRHRNPITHAQPFSATLVFTPGALLRNGQGCTPADWDEVTSPDGQISDEGYYGLYRRRLLPVLRYINAHAREPRRAFVTIPGLGCGQFAGPFNGQLGARLQSVLERLLATYGASFPNIRAIYFDPYAECTNARFEMHGVSLMVRPLTQAGNQSKPQLCTPTSYAEGDDDFSMCRLYSVVAWDHVSWPGNDFYLGARVTDDGVKAAATDVMTALTGVVGRYDASLGQYQPPDPFRNWNELVRQGLNGETLRLWHDSNMWTVTAI